MPNEWKVILRAADDLDLSEAEKEQYVHHVTGIYADKVTNAPTMTERDRYNAFLNEQVFSDPRLVEFIEEVGASQEAVARFREGEVDVESLISSWNRIQFTLDELIDLLMVLKFIRDYSATSQEARVESRYRLQKLLYLINAQLREETNPGQQNQFENELEMLDRTGYRYRFLRRDSGPYSELAYEDKNRLFAWSLVDEPVISDQGTGEVAERNRQYGLELSAQGEIFTEQFYNDIEDSDNLMVQAWNLAQKDVIEQTVGMSQSELHDHVTEVTDTSVETGDEFLSGPNRKFRKNDVEFLDQLAERMESMMTTTSEIQKVEINV